MAGVLIRKAFRKTLTQVRHICVVPPANARGVVATVYADSERDFGLLAAPVALHSPAPSLLAASWVLLRETLLAAGAVDRTTKEAVATAVAISNACAYCADLHLTTLELLNERRDAMAGMESDAVASADHAIRKITEWARASGTRAAARDGLRLPAEQFPELVGLVVAAHYLNRMVTVFLPESPLPEGLPAGARPGALRLLGRSVLLAANRAPAPGASLDLLADAPLPEDMSWAAGNPALAGAFARAAAAIEAAGERSVPPAVRDLVRTKLAAWSGDSDHIGASWLSQAVSGLSEQDRPAGRLALLTALAPYQVDQSVIHDLRRTGAGDQTLVEVTSWASMAAARQIGSWIPPSRGVAEHTAQIVPFLRRVAPTEVTVR